MKSWLINQYMYKKRIDEKEKHSRSDNKLILDITTREKLNEKYLNGWLSHEISNHFERIPIKSLTRYLLLKLHSLVFNGSLTLFCIVLFFFFYLNFEKKNDAYFVG